MGRLGGRGASAAALTAAGLAWSRWRSRTGPLQVTLDGDAQIDRIALLRRTCKRGPLGRGGWRWAGSWSSRIAC